MNAIESLLNAANRSHEESAFYVRRSDGVTRSVRVTRESGDLAPYTADDTPQTYRVVVFSADADSLGGPPQRGDVLYLGTETFRVVEQDGVTWQRRFETYGGRIFFFAEKVSDITVPAPPGGDGPYVPPEVCSSVFDEVTITQGGDGKWGVDANYMEEFLGRTADVTIRRADKRYLHQSLFPYSEWDSEAEYETGDVVFQNGVVYEATEANELKEPASYSQGAAAVWKPVMFSTAAFATTSSSIRTSDGQNPGTPSPGSGSGDAQPSGGSLPRPVSGTEDLLPTTAAVVEYVESRFSDAETRTITGDGITRVFELPLEGARKPAVELYNAAGRRCFCASTSGGAGKVTIIFYEAPEAGETFRVVLR